MPEAEYTDPEVRKIVRERSGGKCEHPGCSNRGEHVHHKTYKNVGNEDPEDLEFLCSFHHGTRHGGSKYHNPKSINGSGSTISYQKTSNVEDDVSLGPIVKLLAIVIVFFVILFLVGSFVNGVFSSIEKVEQDNEKKELAELTYQQSLLIMKDTNEKILPKQILVNNINKWFSKGSTWTAFDVNNLNNFPVKILVSYKITHQNSGNEVQEVIDLVPMGTKHFGEFKCAACYEFNVRLEYVKTEFLENEYYKPNK